MATDDKSREDGGLAVFLDAASAAEEIIRRLAGLAPGDVLPEWADGVAGAAGDAADILVKAAARLRREGGGA